MKYSGPPNPTNHPFSSSGSRTAHPAGPLLYRVACAQRARIVAGLVGLAAIAALVAVGTLTPDPSGIGTHTQLGVGPCAAPRLWGIPCPTCGITTSLAHAARGQVLRALIVQPVGLLIAAGLAAIAVGGLAILVSGRRWVVNWWRVRATWLAAAIVAVVLLAWLYKIATY